MGGCRLSRRGRGELLTSPNTQHTAFHIDRIEPAPTPYPHEARRTPRKDPVALHDLALPPRVRPAARAGVRGAGRGGGAFDVVVEAFDDVAGARLFEVGGFVAEDLVFEGGLGGERGSAR